jgi:hypothetical protein
VAFDLLGIGYSGFVSHFDYFLNAALRVGPFKSFQIKQKTENAFQSFLGLESQIFKSVKVSGRFPRRYVQSNMMIISN